MQPDKRGALRKGEVNRDLANEIASLGDDDQFCGIGGGVGCIAQPQLRHRRRIWAGVCERHGCEKDEDGFKIVSVRFHECSEITSSRLSRPFSSPAIGPWWSRPAGLSRLSS